MFDPRTINSSKCHTRHCFKHSFHSDALDVCLYVYMYVCTQVGFPINDDCAYFVLHYYARENLVQGISSYISSLKMAARTGSTV